MKTALISRLGAYGDLAHATHLPRLIKEHYGVTHLTFQTNYAGVQLLQNNPYVDKVEFVDINTMTQIKLQKLWELGEQSADLYFNLFNMLEYKYIAMEDQSCYYRNNEYRRNKFGEINYYDAMTLACGLPEKYLGTTGELYYPESEHKGAKDWVESIRTKYGVKFVILMNLSGSSLHKKFVQCESVSRMLLAKYPDVFIILTGNKDCESQVFEGDRIMSKVSKWNFRTVALQCKYMNLTISLESGLPVISNLWNAPTLQLMTAANRNNHSKYAKNAWTIQSPIYCSPCHKGPYTYNGCPIKDGHPACVFFDEDKIVSTIDEIINKFLETHVWQY